MRAARYCVRAAVGSVEIWPLDSNNPSLYACLQGYPGSAQDHGCPRCKTSLAAIGVCLLPCKDILRQLRQSRTLTLMHVAIELIDIPQNTWRGAMRIAFIAFTITGWLTRNAVCPIKLTRA
jgi:hypothetical protein